MLLSRNKCGALLALCILAFIFMTSYAASQETAEQKNHLLRHNESMKIIDLLDKILANLKNQVKNKRKTKDQDVEDIQIKIEETEAQKEKLSTEFKEAKNRFSYLNNMKESILSDSKNASRSLEQVEKEIDLVKKIKKILVGDKLSSECGSDSDCTEGYTCDRDRCRVPVEGTCMASYECVASAECIYGKCSSVVDRSCEVDSDCSSGTVCYQFKCKITVGDQCSSDDECYTDICENRRCKSPLKGMCVSDMECQEGNTCQDHRCLFSRGEACATNSDCATQYCAPETRDSIDKYCTNNPCDGLSCANSMICDSFAGECRTPPGGLCSNSTQCLGDLVCENEKCMANLQSECDESSQCKTGLCYNSRCKLPSNGSTKCSRNEDCATELCLAESQTCIPGEYALFDEHKIMGEFKLTNNRTQVSDTQSSSARGSALMDISNSKGRWYFEVECKDKSRDCRGAFFGIAEHGHSNGVNGNHYGYRPRYHEIDTHRGDVRYGDNKINYGDVFGVDVDLDGLRIRFSRNGEFFGWHEIESGRYYPVVYDAQSSNWYNTNMTVNTGYTSFKHAPPAKANSGWFGGILLSQCFDDDECFGNLVCHHSKCKLPVEDRCTTNNDCETGFCSQNKCLYHLGEECEHNLQCASGICHNRLCSVGSTSRLNPRSKMGHMEISESRTRVSWSANDNWRGTVLGEAGNEAGKWYYEVECVGDRCSSIRFGIASNSGSTDPSGRFLGLAPEWGKISSSQGDNGDFSSDYAMRTGDIAGIYVDLDNHRVGFSMNGMWKGWSRTMPQGIYYPAIWDNDNDRIADVRVNFGHYDFKYYNDMNYHKGWFGGSILSTCRSNVNCEGRLVCDEARCRYPLRDSCSSDNECSTPWCFNNKCLLKVGDYCSYGDECASGECSHGRCSTKQFTTFDPSTAAGQASLSSGFTEVDMNPRGFVLGNTANTYGKWYYEVECMSHTCHRMSAGIATDIGTYYPEGEYYAFSFDYECTSNSRSDHGFSNRNIRDGDVVGVAVDLEAGKIGYYLNGDWLGWCFSNVRPNYRYAPTIFDNDNDQSTSAMVNFGYYDFHYDVPSGFNRGWFGGLLLSSCEESKNGESSHGCQSGYMCYEGFCRLPPSGTCSHPDECSTTSCYNGKCVQLAGDRCKQDDECATGSCVEGRCNTGDYAVWNPRASVGSLVTKDSANTIVHAPDNQHGVMLGTIGKTSGKYYFEVECLDYCRSLQVGVATTTGSSHPDGHYMGYAPYYQRIEHEHGNDNYGSFDGNSEGEVMGIYIDLDQRRIGVKQRNQWMGWLKRNMDKLDSGEKYFPAVWNEWSYYFTIRTNFGFYEWQYEVEEEYAHGWI